jgi:hypothetical protein
MKRPLDAAATDQTTSAAANEEFVTSPAFEEVARTSGSGWDPYEVWRTRVKEESDLLELGTRTA